MYKKLQNENPQKKEKIKGTLRENHLEMSKELPSSVAGHLAAV